MNENEDKFELEELVTVAIELTPVVEVLIEEQIVEEQPIEELFAEEQPAVEQPAEEILTEEIPVDGLPIVEKPVEKKVKEWYILKVQVNREDKIKDSLVKRVQLAGLTEFFEDFLVPTEKVTAIKNGQKRVTKKKLYPGYIMVKMEITDATWFLVRETPGIGDFTGAGGKPVPMLAHEVQRMIQTEVADTQKAPKLNISYKVGDNVKIVDGTFKDVKGEVMAIDDNTGRITVNITIFGRGTPVDLEYWQVEVAED